ncbi:hypothetical protein BDZ97DRAFT_492423 [Flammula alnicola]|nr:hypothetical protein BDZ97DRAFT_492423 [Flammula alnicola]
MTKYVHSATLKEGSEFLEFVAQNPHSTVLNVEVAHRPTVKVENEESKPAASSVQDQGPKSEPVDDLKAAIPDTNVDIDIRRECSESKPPPKSEGEIIATCESDPKDIKILVKKDETDVLEIDPGHIDEPFSSGIPVYEDVEMLDRPSRPTMDTHIAPEVPVIKQEPQ